MIEEPTNHSIQLIILIIVQDSGGMSCVRSPEVTGIARDEFLDYDDVLFLKSPRGAGVGSEEAQLLDDSSFFMTATRFG